MNIFVTGATGLVGANVVRLLVKEKMGKVRVLVRPTSNLLSLKDLPVEVVHGDVTDARSVEEGMKGCDLVYHVAGYVYMGERPGEVKRLYEVNAGGTKNVCKAALKLGVKKLVHTSSDSTTGWPKKPGEVADETTDNSHLDHDGLPYARSKKKGEDIVFRYVKKGLPAVIVNPSFMIGEWDVKPSSGRIIVLAKKIGIPFYPMGGTNVIDVQDAAQGHLLAMEKGEVGERYILGHRNMSFRELLTLIHKVVGRRPPFIPLYEAPAKLFARLVQPFSRLLPAELQDVVSPKAVETGSKSRIVSSAKAISSLGIAQSPVEEAIERAYRWFRQNGYC